MSDSTAEMSAAQILSPHLQDILLRSILDEWSPKLGIDGAAKVITSNVATAETLAQWIVDSYGDQPYDITVLEAKAEKDIDPKLAKSATISTKSKIQDQTATHSFSHIEQYSRDEALWVFKKIFYSLVPKGVAIVTCWRENPLQDVMDKVLEGDSRGSQTELHERLGDGDLVDLAEEAQFERGKIRSCQKSVSLKGGALDQVISDLRARLQVAMKSSSDATNLSTALDQEVKKRLSNDGSLECAAELILAMRWDLLCA